MAHIDPETISAYIDMELPPDEIRQVEDHLASCDTCREEYHELRGLSTLVRQLPLYTPRRVIAIDDTQANRGPTTMGTLVEFSRPIALAAAIILIAFAGLRLAMELTEDDADDPTPIPAVQEDAAGDGTDPAAQTSEQITADEAAPAGQDPADTDGQAAEGEVQEEAESARDQGDTAPAAAEQNDVETIAEPTAEPGVASEAEDDGGDGWLRMTVAIVLAAIIASGGTWLLLNRTRRRSNE